MRLKSQKPKAITKAKAKQNQNLTEPLKIKVLLVPRRNGGNILIILSANKLHTHTHAHTPALTHVDRRVANVFDISACGVYTLTHINYHLSCLVAPALPVVLAFHVCFELLPIESLWVKDFALQLCVYFFLFCILIEYAFRRVCVCVRASVS